MHFYSYNRLWPSLSLFTFLRVKCIVKMFKFEILEDLIGDAMFVCLCYHCLFISWLPQWRICIVPNYKCNTPSFWLIKLFESSSDLFSSKSRTSSSSSWASFSISSDAGFVCCDCCEPLDTWLLREYDPRRGAANVRWFAGFTVIINLALFATIMSVTCECTSIGFC